MPREIETLSRIPLFSSMDKASIKALDTRCSWRHVAAKEWVIDYQAEGIDVFFVVGGSVRVLIYAKSGREVILADLSAGGFFGELAAIDGKPRSAGVLAITHAVVAAMQAPAAQEVFKKQNFNIVPNKSVDDAKAWLAGEMASWKKIADEVKIETAE